MPAADASLAIPEAVPLDLSFQSSTMLVELRGRRMYFFPLNTTGGEVKVFREEFLVIEIGGFAEFKQSVYRAPFKEVHFGRFLTVSKDPNVESWTATSKLEGGGDMVWTFDFSKASE